MVQLVFATRGRLGGLRLESSQRNRYWKEEKSSELSNMYLPKCHCSGWHVIVIGSKRHVSWRSISRRFRELIQTLRTVRTEISDYNLTLPLSYSEHRVLKQPVLHEEVNAFFHTTRMNWLHSQYMNTTLDCSCSFATQNRKSRETGISPGRVYITSNSKFMLQKA